MNIKIYPETQAVTRVMCSGSIVTYKRMVSGLEDCPASITDVLSLDKFKEQTGAYDFKILDTEHVQYNNISTSKTTLFFHFTCDELKSQQFNMKQLFDIYLYGSTVCTLIYSTYHGARDVYLTANRLIKINHSWLDVITDYEIAHQHLMPFMGIDYANRFIYGGDAAKLYNSGLDMITIVPTVNLRNYYILKPYFKRTFKMQMCNNLVVITRTPAFGKKLGELIYHYGQKYWQDNRLQTVISVQQDNFFDIGECIGCFSNYRKEEEELGGVPSTLFCYPIKEDDVKAGIDSPGVSRVRAPSIRQRVGVFLNTENRYGYLPAVVGPSSLGVFYDFANSELYDQYYKICFSTFTGRDDWTNIKDEIFALFRETPVEKESLSKESVLAAWAKGIRAEINENIDKEIKNTQKAIDFAKGKRELAQNVIKKANLSAKSPVPGIVCNNINPDTVTFSIKKTDRFVSERWLICDELFANMAQDKGLSLKGAYDKQKNHYTITQKPKYLRKNRWY